MKRERRRGLIQVRKIADSITYSPKGNHVKAVIYKKSRGSGVFVHTSGNIMNVEIKGKCDFALTESFKKWVEDFNIETPHRICLMVRTDWVSSQFVGAIVLLNHKIKDAGSAMSVWTEHKSCYRIMQQLGLTAYVHIYDSLETAQMSLQLADVESGIFSSPNRSKTTTTAPAEADDEIQSPVHEDSDTMPEKDMPRKGRGWLSRLFGRFGHRE